MIDTDQAAQSRQVLGTEVSNALLEIIRSQIELAKGICTMWAKEWVTDKKGERQRNGKFYQVTDKNEIEELLNGDGEGDYFYRIWTKDPNPKAASYLFDQIAGKAKESIDINQKNQTLADIIAALENK